MKKVKNWIPSTWIFIVLILSLMVGATYAKYAKEDTVNDTISISAHLGNISVSASTNYQLIPGHDVPLGHRVEITNKSPIPAYVFVEVTGAQSNESEQLDFAEDEAGNWKKLEIAGRNIFVYRSLVYSNTDITFDVLMIVPQSIKGATVTDLNVTAYLGQVYENKTAQQVFTELFISPASN